LKRVAAYADPPFGKLAGLRDTFSSTLVTLCKRVEERQEENQRLMDALQAKILPTLTAMELKPLQAQLNAYNMQKAHQKVLLDRMHVFGKLFSFTRENHRFDQGMLVLLFLLIVAWCGFDLNDCKSPSRCGHVSG
jgi:hypothetical protein